MIQRRPSGTAILRATLYVGLGILVVMFSSMWWNTNSLVSAIRDSQKDRAPVLDSTKHAADDAAHASRDAAKGVRLIESCLNSTGKCYKEGQKTQAQFSHLFVASTVCAARIVPKYPDVNEKVLIDKVTVCAVAQLARQGREN